MFSALSFLACSSRNVWSTDLDCVASGTDADGDSISYTYAWTVNGADAGSSATLAAGTVSKGDIIAFEVFGVQDTSGSAKLCAADT